MKCVQWYKNAKRYEDQEKEDYFYKRTEKHISLVQKYCKKIDNYNKDRFKGIIERGESHDQSKYGKEEKGPYINITEVIQESPVALA